MIFQLTELCCCHSPTLHKQTPNFPLWLLSHPFKYHHPIKIHPRLTTLIRRNYESSKRKFIDYYYFFASSHIVTELLSGSLHQQVAGLIENMEFDRDEAGGEAKGKENSNGIHELSIENISKQLLSSQYYIYSGNGRERRQAEERSCNKQSTYNQKEIAKLRRVGSKKIAIKLFSWHKVEGIPTSLMFCLFVIHICDLLKQKCKQESAAEWVVEW